jgi:DNA-binding CsgD family transcriptional regulator
MGLVDREKEISGLGRLYSDCLQGKSSVVMIAGFPGSGKTALLQAFSERVASSNAIVLSATAFRAEDALPLGILSQLFGNRDLRPSLADSARQLMNDCVQVSMPAERQFESVAQATTHAFEGLRQLLVDVAEERPVVISVDDVENADSLSLQCLQYFARRTKDSRILIVLSECTATWPTKSRLHTDLRRQPNYYLFQLARLSQSGVATLLGEHIGAAPPPDLAHDLYSASGGNPLLVRALIDDLNMSVGTSPTLTPLGSSFRAAALNCLHRCDPTAVSVARALAVMGHETSPARLSEMLGISPAAIGDAIASLEATGFLNAGWFRHDAVAAAVLVDTDPEERATLHSRSAEVLHLHDEPIANIAAHLIAADRIEPSWAVPMLQDAAEQALARNQVGVAIRCLQRAYEASTSERERAIIRSALAGVEWRADPANATRYLPELVQAVHQGSLAGRHATAVVGYLLWHGQTSEAADVLAALHPPAKEREEEWAKQVPEVYIARLWVEYSYPELVSRITGAATVLRREVASLVSPPYRAEATMLESALGGRAEDDVVMLAERILQGSRLDDVTFAPILAALVSLIGSEQLPRAARWCKQLLEDAKARDIPLWQATLASVHALIDFRQGNLSAAERNAHAALTMFTPRSWGVVIGAPLACLLLATTAAGKLGEAAQYLQIPVPETMFQTPLGLLYLQARGKYFLLTGRAEAALADFLSCQELMTKWRLDQPGLVSWRTDCAQVLLSMGKNSLARDLAKEQLSLLHARQRRTRGISLRMLALASAPSARPALLREAIEALTESGARLELANVLADLSWTYQALGEQRRSQVLAHQARDLAEQCGAEPLKHTLPDLDTTAPTEVADAAQLSSLTEAERRVASLAAEGYSNQQISRQLRVTVSNVEQHLTRVFRKLGVNSRSDLPLEIPLNPTQPEGTPSRNPGHEPGTRLRTDPPDDATPGLP